MLYQIYIQLQNTDVEQHTYTDLEIQLLYDKSIIMMKRQQQEYPVKFNH